MNKAMYYQAENGDSSTFIPKKFKPLTYAELLTADINKTKIYEMDIEAEFLEIQISNKLLPKKYGSMSVSITFNQSLPIYALVEDGWLPPPFVMPTNLLVDRNVVGYLEQITKGNSRFPYSESDWWLQLIDNPEVVINPFLFAFEGNQKKPPNFNEFKSSFEEASTIIKKRFPQAKIVTYNDFVFKAAFNEISSILNHQQETDFLMQTVPLICNPVAEKGLSATEVKILKIARDLNLSLKSLPVLAILSCLYENKRILGFNTARKVLHIAANYTVENAYNALSDLRGLLIYLAFLAIAKIKNCPPFAFCSADRAIILFGCGLNFRNAKFIGKGLNVDFTLSEHLFPRLSEPGRIKLAEQLRK